jgi:hypothetical protein
MKYAVDMGSGAVIYITSFIKIDSGIQKLRVGFIDTDGLGFSLAYFYFFFQNKESRPTKPLR